MTTINITAREIVMRPVSDLAAADNNSRQHSDEHINQIAVAITQWGWTIPVLIDDNNQLIAGHGRVLAAQRLGMTEVPCIVAAGWSEAQKRAYLIADNKLHDNSTWDKAVLTAELEALRDLDVNLATLGFNESELRKMLETDTVQVESLPTTPVNDVFWITMRGPLEAQADALLLVEKLRFEMPVIEIDVGTIGDG